MKRVRQNLLRSVAVLTALTIRMAPAEESGRQPFRSALPLDALRSVDPADAKVSSEILIRRIVEEQGFDYSAVVPETHAEFLVGLKQNQYDFFLIFSYEYLKHREAYPMTPSVVGVRDGDSPMERLILVSRADVEIGDLAGGKLLIQSGTGELAAMWLEEELADQGVADPAGFFGEVENTRSVGQAVVPVFFGKADACIVAEGGLATMAELNPQIDVRLTRKLISDPLLTSLMCVRAGYEEKEPGTIETVSTNLHKTPDGGQTLTLMRIEKLVRFEESYLEGTEKLLRRRSARLAAANAGDSARKETGNRIAQEIAEDDEG